MSYMLIHSVSWGVWGKYEDWEDSKHLMDMVMTALTDHYAAHTRMKRKKIRKLLKRDSWFNVEECLALGLADRIR
jgi:ATP-dependent protease ClpP protease subunit